MNFIKKIAAVILVVMMVMSVAACHPKDEIAVTVDGVEFTSAYYMCALIFADSEARTKVDEQIAEESEDDETTSTDDVNYYKQKIDEKNFVDWVKDRAIENLKQIAAYKIKCEENKVEIEEDVINYAEQYASYYWSSYGYSSLLEPNGISEATYKKYMVDTYYSSAYFEHLYGEGGEKEISADEVNSALLENYLIADMIDVSTSSMEDDEKTSTKEKLDGYVTALTAGTKSFEEVYHEYYETDAEEAHSDTDEETEEGETPLDSHASVLGSEDTSYASDYFESAKAMTVGEVKLIEKEDESGYVLLVKQDISADPYYLKNLDLAVRNLLKGEEFEEEMESYAKDLETDINNYAVKQFKVKKIKYPESTT